VIFFLTSDATKQQEIGKNYKNGGTAYRRDPATSLYFQSRMLRPRSPCGLEAKSFGLGLNLTLSGLVLDLGLMASGLIQIGLVVSNIYSVFTIQPLTIISVVYWLLTENNVLNENMLVFKFTHTR